MAGIDDMGAENSAQGICGFTSTLYAVYTNKPQLHSGLEKALDAGTRRTRLMAEIKTFLQMMKAAGKGTVLSEITELTKTFPGYGQWSVDSFIAKINKLEASGDYSIAMPPGPLVEYMRTSWDLTPVLTDDNLPGEAILGLTRTGGPRNRWKNLAHYVYRNPTGKILSWGEQFDDLADVNKKKGKDYSVIYRVKIHG